VFGIEVDANNGFFGSIYANSLSSLSAHDAGYTYLYGILAGGGNTLAGMIKNNNMTGLSAAYWAAGIYLNTYIGAVTPPS